MNGDMTEPLMYSQNSHQHCTNAVTCLVSAAGYCLEPGARQLAVHLRGGSLGSQWDWSCRESCLHEALTACSSVNQEALEPK